MALGSIFDKHDDVEKPRRILIRGRPGVGKSTLCKKMVYEFIYGHGSDLNRKWNALFDRILWIPLRNLQRRGAPGYNLEQLFFDEFFSADGTDTGHHLAKKLWNEIKPSLDGGNDRTLFVLDGLDEISSYFDHPDMMDFLTALLNRRNVIVTSRPHASIPTLHAFDLELTTVGFDKSQVKAYLKIDSKTKTRERQLSSFIDNHRRQAGLFRIPVQLDALCFAWEEFSETARVTMTDIFQAIERALWKKDTVRMGKQHSGDSIVRGDIALSDVEDLVQDELVLLERLAFFGLIEGEIYFDDAMIRRYKPQGMVVGKSLPRLSFLRSPDTTVSEHHRIYHFMHLTFQEYFAARYFTRIFLAGHDFEYDIVGQTAVNRDVKEDPPTSRKPTFLIRHYMYDHRFRVFWAFVAGICGKCTSAEEARFLRAIHQAPRDLLGLCHLDFLLDCLVESTTIPIEIEEELLFWAQSTAHLGDQDRFVRFPEPVILRVVQEVTELTGSFLSHETTKTGFRNEELLLWLVEQQDGEHGKAASSFLVASRPLPDAVTSLLMERIRHNRNEDVLAKSIACFDGTKAPQNPLTLSAVQHCLDNPTEKVRAVAVRYLGSALSAGCPVVDAIASRIQDLSGLVGCAALEELQRQEYLPESALLCVIHALLHYDDSTVLKAADFLWDLVGSGRHVTELVHQALLTASSRCSNYAVGYATSRALVFWIVFFRHQESNRFYKAFNFCRRHAHSPECLAVLRALLSDELFRLAALLLLIRCTDLGDVHATVVECFSDPDAHIRRVAVEVIANGVEWRHKAVLLDMVHDEDDWVREGALRGLSQHTDIPDVRLLFLERLKDSKTEVRELAINGLSNRVGNQDVRSALLGMLHDPSPNVREAALSQLSLAFEALHLLFKDKNHKIRDADSRIHAYIGLEEDVRDGLLDMLDNPDIDIQTTAIAAIHILKYIITTPEVYSSVLRLLHDDRMQVRLTAARLLAKVSHLPPVCTPLSQCLAETDTDASVRYAAFTALRNAPSAIATVRTEVVRFLDDTQVLWDETPIQGLLDDPEFTQMIIEKLTSPKIVVRQRAIQLLAYNGLSWECFERVDEKELYDSLYPKMFEECLRSDLATYVRLLDSKHLFTLFDTFFMRLQVIWLVDGGEFRVIKDGRTWSLPISEEQARSITERIRQVKKQLKIDDY